MEQFVTNVPFGTLRANIDKESDIFGFPVWWVFFFFFLVSLVSCFNLHFVFSNDERMGTAMHTQERSRYS